MFLDRNINARSADLSADPRRTSAEWTPPPKKQKQNKTKQNKTKQNINNTQQQQQQQNTVIDP